jgi:putative DNA primase/helicase
MGNAQRFVKDHAASVRHCWPWRKWLVWACCRWRVDDAGKIAALAKQTVKRLYDDAIAKLAALKADSDDDEQKAQLVVALKALIAFAIKSEDARALARMLDLARSEDGVPVQPDDLDGDPWLLNCVNGTVDLRTGELRAHRRQDYFTQLCPTAYVPTATCPLFTATVDSIFDRDEDLSEFVQRYSGYSLTGDVREQSLHVWWGAGANGKSLLINTLLDVIGSDYAGTVPAELMMMDRHGSQHPTILADLFRKRLMVATETAAGGRLNEERIKLLTGGDVIKARRMREDYWSFSPTHKLILVTNHKPNVRGTEHAVWRRLRLVPFGVQYLHPAAPENAGKVIPPDRVIDRHLAEKLKAEREGTLAWLVRGCLASQADGLSSPAVVQQATAEYRSSQDMLATFMEERCITNPAVRCGLRHCSTVIAGGARGLERGRSRGRRWRKRCPRKDLSARSRAESGTWGWR